MMRNRLHSQTKTVPAGRFTPLAARTLQPTCACGKPLVAGGKCEACRIGRAGGLQRSAINTAPVPAVPPLVADALRTPGQPLDATTRGEMEGHFGHDFSSVRVHADPVAATSAHAISAHAYTVGQDIVFGSGRYAPGTGDGRRLLAHELTHTVQQKGAGASSSAVSTVTTAPNGPLEVEADTAAARVATDPTARAGVIDPSERAANRPAMLQRQDEPGGTAITDVRSALGEVSPIAGVGNFPKAYKILDGLPAATILEVCANLDDTRELEVLYANFGAATGVNRDRIEVLIFAAFRRSNRLTPEQAKRVPGLFAALTSDDRMGFESFLDRAIGAHERTIFTKGEAAEIERLASLQTGFWEAKRKQQEAAARQQAEEDAKKKGQPAPATAPKIGIEQVVKEEVGKRAIKPSPTAEWDNLSPSDKNNWETVRAPAAFKKVTDSAKGTEIEGILKGKGFKFEPVKIFKQGAYAYQDGTNLVAGMSFVKDAERDPRSVLGLVVHELGGHFEYGTTYASKIMEKAMLALPEAERKKFESDPQARYEFFTAYSYAETEIFSALRQRRYDVPVTGPKPVHGAISPDDNIEKRLTQIDSGFPKEVGTAILSELKKKVDAHPDILDRDKKYFLEQVKKHGYAL